MAQKTGGVYVQTNDSERNEVIAFRRGIDGGLEQIGVFATGGAGDGIPHLTSQGSVVLTGDGRHLLVTNAASNDVSLFAVTPDGLELLDHAKTGGTAPKSVSEHEGLVYVVNNGSSSLAGFRIDNGRLQTVEGSSRELSAAADAAQVSFTPDGSAVVVTERATDSISVYVVEADGGLGDAKTVPSSGATPYGFAFTSGGTLVVTEAFGAQPGKAAASSYRMGVEPIAPITRSARNGLSEICWAVISKDDRYAFTTNFADGKISRYRIADDGSLELDDPAAAITVENVAGVRDEGLTTDGRFLYAVDADARRIFGFTVGDDGALDPVGSWDGLPATVAGLAAS